MSIAADIVTAHDGQRTTTGSVPAAKTRCKIAVDGLGRPARNFGADDRIIKVQLAGFIKVIAAFGNRNCDGMHAFKRDQPFRFRGLPRPVRKLDMGADKSIGRRRRCSGIFEQIAVIALLRHGEGRALRGAQIDSGNAPGQVAGMLHIIVDIDGLMGTMEGAITDMHDADPACGAVVIRRENRRVSYIHHQLAASFLTRSKRASAR